MYGARFLNPYVLTLLAAALTAIACSSGPNNRFVAVDGGPPNDMEEPKGPCTLPNIMCGRVCVNPAESSTHCGGCGISCGGTRVCVNGRCDNECPEEPARQSRCGDRCTDTNVDRMNCGECGVRCPEGQVCSGGACRIECGPQYTSCLSVMPDAGVRRDASLDVAPMGPAARCADLRIDDQHCGACGNACPLGFACVDGTCELRCPRGQTVCGARCVDLATSTSDCGACGNACTGLQRCVAGVCTGMTCPAGTTQCGSTCADTQVSADHCGRCDNACPAPQFCRAGRCVLECPTGRTACDMRCVDLETDRTHCGMCGNVCPAGQVCEARMCRFNCPMGSLNCMGRCVDPSTDRTNCGACGNTCGAGQLCTGGSCAPRCADTQTNCGGVCVNTTVDPSNCGACGLSCGPGYACSAGFCRALVGTDVAGCASPSLLCGGICADVRNDNTNCGRCGMRCTADRVCVLGMCVAPCETGLSRCGASCVNLQGDRANCGRCGSACAASLSCVSGVCTTEPTLRVDMFSTNMSTCRIVELGATVGDDRGGIALSRSRVFYTGDTATIHASLTDLSEVMTATPPPHDGLLNDVGSGEIYVMLNAMGAEVTGTFLFTPFTITQLGVLNGTTGALTMTRIPLSMPITVGSGAAIFSGRSRAYIHTGSVSPLPAGAMTNTWYQIRLPSGVVSVLRTGVTAPTRTACESWATWGIAEFFDGEAYAVFASSVGIQRYRIRDAMTTTLATSPTMTTPFADMCTFTVSPSNNRWYFKWEGSGFAGGIDEVLGFCDATISMP